MDLKELKSILDNIKNNTPPHTELEQVLIKTIINLTEQINILKKELKEIQENNN